jgi:hypothetical protein
MWNNPKSSVFLRQRGNASCSEILSNLTTLLPELGRVCPRQNNSSVSILTELKQYQTDPSNCIPEQRPTIFKGIQQTLVSKTRQFKESDIQSKISKYEG